MKNKIHIDIGVMRYFLISVIIVSFVFTGLQAVSRTNSIDSIKQLLQNASQKQKGDIYYSISKSYRSFNVDSSEKYANLGLNYALLDNNTQKVVDYQILLSSIEMTHGKFSKAFSILDEAGALCEHNKNYQGLAKIKMERGNHYIKLSDFSNVFKEYRAALEIVNANKIKSLEAFVLNRLGFMYLRINDLYSANNYVDESIKSSLDNNDSVYYAFGLLLKGDVLDEKGDKDSSVYFYKKALALVRVLNNIYLLPKIHESIGDYYTHQDNYGLALMYFDSSIVVSKQNNSLHQLATVLAKKAHVYSLIQNYDSTIKYNKEALKVRQSLGEIAITCSSIISIGGNYTKLQKYDTALLYLEKGIDCAKKYRRIDFLAYGYEKMVDFFEAQGDYENAITYTDLYSKYNDSVLMSKTNNRIAFFSSQFELEKEKALSHFLKNEKKADWIFYLKVFIFLALFIIILFIIIRIREKKAIKKIEKLSKVVETISQAVVISNKDGDIVYVNNGFLKMGGYDDKEVFNGKSLFDLPNIDGKILLKNEILPTLVRTGNWSGEVIYKKNDGQLMACENTYLSILSKENEPELFVGIFSDISRRKQSEDDLKKSTESLINAVATRDKMFSIIANNLTGPFRTIMGFSKLMATEFDDYQTEDHIRFSQLIYESSKQTFGLLTNLLHWSRSQLSNVELFMEDYYLHNLIAENCEPLKLMINNKKLSFHNNVSNEVKITIDVNTMGVVIQNLISNAIKYTPSGGTISVTSQVLDNKTIIMVSDTGVGIKSENIPNLFNNNSIFFEVDSKGEKSVGLGLVLCKEFVELNNGTIQVESKFGIGSKFTISLQS